MFTRKLTGTPGAIRRAMTETRRKLRQAERKQARQAKQQYCYDARHDTPCPLPCSACAEECVAGGR